LRRRSKRTSRSWGYECRRPTDAGRLLIPTTPTAGWRNQWARPSSKQFVSQLSRGEFISLVQRNKRPDTCRIKVYESMRRLKNSHQWCEKLPGAITSSSSNDAPKPHQISTVLMAWLDARLCSSLLHKFPASCQAASKAACRRWRKSRRNWRGKDDGNERGGGACSEDS